MTEKRKYLPIAAIAAVALVAAACSNNDSTPVATGATGDTTTVTVPQETANTVTLPEGHGITEAGDRTIAAGTSVKVAGVRIFCPGETACTVTIEVDDEEMVSATYDGEGGTPHAELLNNKGFTAFENLAAALLDTADTDTNVPGVQSVLNDLRENLYHDTPDVMASTGPPAVAAVDGGGGVTTSLTTHNQPGSIGTADPLSGVSDIMVTVVPETVDDNEEDDTKTVDKVDPDGAAPDATPPDTTAMTDPWEIMNPVLVDAEKMLTNGRTANFKVNAAWDLNPAAQWMSQLTEGAPAMGMNDFWTYISESDMDGQVLAGGRTLHLDLRTDFNPNHMSLAPLPTDGEDPVDGDAMRIARGPDSNGTDLEVKVPWNMIMLMGVDLGLGGEINLAEDDGMGMPEGIPGSYMGIKGIFVCEDGSASGDDGQGICRINHHENGYMGVSEDDFVVFRPYMYSADTDWLTAGVWLTIPDDLERGDYAIGSFVYGNDPFKPSADDARLIEGTATYQGEAFGRFAESDTGNEETGRFTADAVLVADFNDHAVDGNDFGVIYGDLTGFMTHVMDEAGDTFTQGVDWDVNFESAMITLEADTNDDAVDNTALRFNSGATGHAGGHALAGYHNGQFYGSERGEPNGETPGAEASPGSVAGTFGLTDTNTSNDYSLTMSGAYAAHGPNHNSGGD